MFGILEIQIQRIKFSFTRAKNGKTEISFSLELSSFCMYVWYFLNNKIKTSSRGPLKNI